METENYISEALRVHYEKVRHQRELRYSKKLKGRTKAIYIAARVARPILNFFKFLRELFLQTRSCGAAVKRNEGISVLRQTVQQLRLGVRSHLPVSAYYQFMLYREKNWRRAEQFIHHEQMDALLNDPVYDVPDWEKVTLKDKTQFYVHCQSNDLDTIDILAVLTANELRHMAWGDNESLPQTDLFSKPVDAWQGKGAKRWIYISGGRYRDGGGHVVGTEELLMRLTEQAQKAGAIILQERQRNHKLLTALTGETLCSARMVTGRKPGRSPELIMSMIGLPVGDRPVANYIVEYGHLGAAVDDSGRLGHPRYKQPSRIMESVIFHPVTEKKIPGFRLPHWDEAVSLVLRAHRTFPNIAFIGWDVAFTDKGPLLIEGNQGFGAESLQVTHGKPLSATLFGDYYIQHINQQRSMPSMDVAG